MRLQGMVNCIVVVIIVVPSFEDTEIRNGDVRLENGNETAGRVELYNNFRWGTVCDDNWGITDARVICRQLGFYDALRAHSGALFGMGKGPIHINNVNCDGTETSLTECYFSLPDDCNHGQDAGVTCLPFAQGSLRLAGGDLESGRVELYFHGQWGTVCDDAWDIREATVVCRQLGFKSAISASKMAAYGAGDGPIHMGSVECMGDEWSLLDCEYKRNVDCRHIEDAGVSCSNLSGNVRLSGGDQSSGRVEVYFDNQWGTVCDDDWDIEDATVVCRQLGFKSALSAPRKAAFGEGVGPIHVTSVRCTGHENSLMDCEYKRKSDCMHNEDASATCSDVSYTRFTWIAIVIAAVIVITITGAFFGVLCRKSYRHFRRPIGIVSGDVPTSANVSVVKRRSTTTYTPSSKSLAAVLRESVKYIESDISVPKQEAVVHSASEYHTIVPAEKTNPSATRDGCYLPMRSNIVGESSYSKVIY